MRRRAAASAAARRVMTRALRRARRRRARARAARRVARPRRCSSRPGSRPGGSCSASSSARSPTRWIHALTGGDWGDVLAAATRRARAPAAVAAAAASCRCCSALDALYPWAAGHAGDWRDALARPAFSRVWLRPAFVAAPRRRLRARLVAAGAAARAPRRCRARRPRRRVAADPRAS